MKLASQQKKINSREIEFTKTKIFVKIIKTNCLPKNFDFQNRWMKSFQQFGLGYRKHICYKSHIC